MINRPTFDSVEEVLRNGVPHRYHLGGEYRPVDLLVDPADLCLALLIPGTEVVGVELVQMEAIRFGWHQVDGQRFFSVAVPDRRLALYAYGFLGSLADELQVKGASIEAALESAIDNWQDLLSKPQGLSRSEVIGLWGEMWFLRELLIHCGSFAVDSWLGPQREDHDFRVANADIEVKTTVRIERTHTIHGLGQLNASPGQELHLLSVHLQPAGVADGKSLGDLVDEVIDIVRENRRLLDTFFTRLEMHGVSREQLSSENDKYRHRSEPKLIPVDFSLPVLSNDLLSGILGKDALLRLRSVDYRIDVTGLGVTISPSFLEERFRVG